MFYLLPEPKLADYYHTLRVAIVGTVQPLTPIGGKAMVTVRRRVHEKEILWVDEVHILGVGPVKSYLLGRLHPGPFLDAGVPTDYRSGDVCSAIAIARGP